MDKNKNKVVIEQPHDMSSVETEIIKVAINIRDLHKEDVESLILIKGDEYMTEEERVECRQLIVEASGIVVNAARREMIEQLSNQVKTSQK